MATAPTTNRNERYAAWFALFGGAVAWTAHLLLSYAVAEFGCVTFGASTWLGLSVVAWLIMGISVASLGLAAAATFVGWRLWKQSHMDRRPQPNVAHFMGRAGYLNSGLFVAIIAVESLPILFYLQRC